MSAPAGGTAGQDGPGPGAHEDRTGAGAPEAAGSPSTGPASGLLSWVEAFDDRVDAWFEPWRGSPAFDGAAKVITGLGDHGLMWAATTLWRARHTGP